MTGTPSSRRETTHLADTGYLLCFGGVPHGLAMLKELFAGGIAAPPAVKGELGSLPKNTKKRQEVRAAADVFNGKNSGILLDAPLYEGDIEERDLAQRSISSKVLPPPHDGTLPAQGALVESVTTGEHCGEAEAIAAAFRRGVPLLITDGPATRHAIARTLPIETAALSLRRLSKSPKEKYRIYREMESSVGNAGDPVNGPMWYREPTAIA